MEKQQKRATGRRVWRAGVGRASIKRCVGNVRCEPHRGARDDGEKVNEALANYGLFRITYVGQSRLLKRPFVVNFRRKNELF